MTEKYAHKLQELTKLVIDEIHIIENGGKLQSYRREVKPKQKELREDLKGLIVDIAKTGQINAELWPHVKNYFIVFIKDLLDGYNAKCSDCKSFQDEKEVILQYLAFFDKAPFTMQRIAELTAEPAKYYKSTKKLLYAYEKLVNVSDPQDR